LAAIPRFDLRLLEIPDAQKAAEGTAMELVDCAFPLLKKHRHQPPTPPRRSTASCCAADRARARARRAWSAPICSRQTGRSSSHRARRSLGAADDVKILVVGNPANTNALIAQSNAPDIPAERFTAMTRLDENRAVAQLANKLVVAVTDIGGPRRVGQPAHRTMFPDLFTAKVKGERAVDAVDDMDWYENEFMPNVGKRGAAIIEARGASSAASAANAAIDHVHDWVLGAEGLHSMGVPSRLVRIDEGHRLLRPGPPQRRLLHSRRETSR